MKSNRTITGDWDGEVISRPKTLGERHPHMTTKHTVLKNVPRIKGSNAWNLYHKKEEMHAKAEETRKKIGAHMNAHSKALTDGEMKSHQNRTGRAYSE